MGKFIKFIITCLTLLIMAGMLVVMYLFIQPGDLPETVGGRKDILNGKLKKGNLLDDIQLALSQKKEITVTEEEVNHYLANKLKVSQGGKLRDIFGFEVSLVGVWVKFTKDTITFYVEREVKWGGGKGEDGRDVAPSSQQHLTNYSVEVITVEDTSGSISRRVTPLDGKFGGMLMPGLFAVVSKAPIDEIQKVLKKEMALIDKMNKITVKDGALVMHATQNVIVQSGASSPEKVKK